MRRPHLPCQADVEFGRIQARDLLQHLLTGPISNAPVDIVRVRPFWGAPQVVCWLVVPSDCRLPSPATRPWTLCG